MKKIMVVSLFISAAFASSGEDYIYEQAWKTVRKAKYTRTVRSKAKSNRLPARVKSEDSVWFDKMQDDLENDAPFDMEGSFKKVDKLL